ncbi:MAG: glycyl-radical enzyme activating protein [Prolixibacteraceae bacterium]
MKGIIFDIQRFSLHDGPGIRTTVFLKGCPFECVWCSNPESIHPKPQLAYDFNKCSQCLDCIEVCPTGALSNSDGQLHVDFDLCNTCGKCVRKCSFSALKIYGEQMSSDEIIQEVLKDESYFKNSGGGITLSGGDPLFQFNFTFELLTKAKENGLNTCLETEGFAPPEQFRKILPLVDLFYFDYKLTDEELHLKYTGKSNGKVLNALQFLCENKANVVLRCIVVPGINDTEEHFQAIAQLSHRYEAIQGIQIMPFHSFGSGKYQQTGKENHLKNLKTVYNEICTTWINRIEKFGGKNVSKG